ARALGARVTRSDDLTALALFWSGAPTEDAALRSESLPDGWCYAAPLSGERLVTVFLTPAAALPRGAAARRALALERISESRLAGGLCAPARGLPRHGGGEPGHRAEFRSRLGRHRRRGHGV
ncbi:hypothetical protein HC022_23805, partial [Salipiger sp. HF18]|uniref:hypothetical protein n=1 Tax=Salipiger sp. HF18 TaxID=2721557 RepID=UPI0016B396ED